jgi:L-amino acid N-acyltransferase YncA
MLLRPATTSDWPAIWQMFAEVIASGDAFAYDTDTREDEARQKWLALPARAWVAENDAGDVVGTYYIRPNQPGRGSHVANAGYMVAAAARGQGLASLLCAHSLVSAKEYGYLAMQFNFVVSTNFAAVKTWEKHGFTIIGRIPEAFEHAQLGFVDALIMWRKL